MTDTRKAKKAVFPVAGFGTRFITATKAIAAGIDTLIFVTGRNKRAIEDHFDANNELETMLRAKGKDVQADMVRNIIPVGVAYLCVRLNSGVWATQYCAPERSSVRLWICGGVYGSD